MPFNEKQKFMKQINKRQLPASRKIVMIFAVFCLLSNFLMAPSSALAADSNNQNQAAVTSTADFLTLVANQTITTSSATQALYGQSNQAASVALKDLGIFTITAYSSDINQTDSDPCTTADGFNICKHNQEDIVAVNGIAFGTKIKIPSLFGDRIFTVHDRMNKRFTSRIDVWMTSYNKAISFGLKRADIQVVQ